MGEKESQGCAARHVREITARAWPMIDAVSEVCDCGDIGENGYGQDGDNDGVSG